MATARKTKAAHRQTQAVEMMLACKDFDTIAAELGYATRSGAWRAVQRALSKQREALAGEYLMLEMQRLDALQVALWDQAMAGDVKAALGCLRIVEQRMALLGLTPQGGRFGNQTSNHGFAESAVVGAADVPNSPGNSGVNRAVYG